MILKNFFLASFLIFVILNIAGCTTVKKTGSTISSNETVEFNQTINSPDESITGECMPHWGCISSTHKAYQLTNCTWTDTKECVLGCVDNECRASKICTRGYKCHGLKKRGLQIESCNWIIDEDCEWGCENATCKPKPNQTAIVEKPVETTIPPATAFHTLNAGSADSIEFEGESHLLSIYFIETERVRLNLDGKKSDWLTAGNSFTTSNINITVIDILFQPYTGGSQAILYTVGGR